LYGGSRVSYKLAEDDELPHQLTCKLWNQPIGLMITIIATIVFVNLLKLESISTAGSVGFLLIFAVVNYVSFKLHKEIKSNRLIALTGSILCFLALITLIVKQFSSDKLSVIIAISIVIFCFLIEFVYKQREKKTGINKT